VAHYNLAINLRERGRLAAAEDILEALACKHRWVFPPYSEFDSSVNIWDVLELLAVVKAEQGRDAEAIDQLRQALKLKLRVWAPRPSASSFFDTWIRLVQILEHDGRLAEAIAELRTLLSVMASASSEDGYLWASAELHFLELHLEERHDSEG
jgi:tetratricopeptide (TPR) repeat protein